ncbi:MAG: hypothetical protein J6Y25_04050 [Elusimicrobiaceae bacterium]|nr:hypothetical protein [Elusimicrobiaceae bacterium]MBP5616193.1 hypothetical protein [Elusimicrobiaceae bacterium]
MTGEMINLIWELAAVIFASGAVWGELKAIRKDIARLEEKQDKYNHLQERVAKIEAKMEAVHD